MQRDGLEAYLDPIVYERTREPFEASLGVDDSNAARAYRRRYAGLIWQAPDGAPRAVCRRVEAVGDLAPGFDQLDGRTRLGRVRTAVARVIDGNGQSVRFGLLGSRQAAPHLDIDSWPAILTDSPDSVQPTDTDVPGQWRAGLPIVSGAGAGVPGGTVLVPADSSTGNAELRRLLARRPGTTGALLPAGWDGPAAVDAPLGLLLDDVRTETARLITADDTCRNTVVVLIASGGDPSLGPSALGDKAASFLALGGRRVPVYVVAIAPAPGEAEQLREVAARSGGQYVEIRPETLERVPASDPVPEIVRALHDAVQHAFAAFSDFNLPPSADQPYGPPSYFPTVGPVVGTVNLVNAVDAGGNLLPSTRVLGPAGQVVPQPSNVLLTAGFDLPGFRGRLSAFRVYRPVADSTRVTGYRFSSDGTRLWTAHAPPVDQRNVYTVLPGTGLVAFRSANAAALAPFLGVSDAAALIDAVRALPLGPSLNSTPALLEPPSARFADPAYLEFVDTHRNRRSLVFAGADDGMMHAFDARTGIEVWAVVPFNLLPKLRRLPEGYASRRLSLLRRGQPPAGGRQGVRCLADLPGLR